MFHSLKTLLPKSLQKHKLAPAIGASLICQKTDKIIIDIIGQSAALKTKTKFVKDGVITIGTNSSIIVAELKMHEKIILEKIRKLFPKNNIKSLRFFY